MFLRTRRLFLRPGWPEDLAAVLRGVGDWEVARNLASVPFPYDETKGREFLARPFDPRAPSLLVTLPEERGAPVIGGCGFGPREASGEIELGYWIARERWGQGYATEAVRGLLSIARASGLLRLEAGHFLDNPASGRVLAKAGFRSTGEIAPRFSLGRGAEAPSLRLLIDLDEVAGCEGGGAMTAAA